MHFYQILNQIGVHCILQRKTQNIHWSKIFGALVHQKILLPGRDILIQKMKYRTVYHKGISIDMKDERNNCS